jgi:hypothetical protein
MLPRDGHWQPFANQICGSALEINSSYAEFVIETFYEKNLALQSSVSARAASTAVLPKSCSLADQIYAYCFIIRLLFVFSRICYGVLVNCTKQGHFLGLKGFLADDSWQALLSIVRAGTEVFKNHPFFQRKHSNVTMIEHIRRIVIMRCQAFAQYR